MTKETCPREAAGQAISILLLLLLQSSRGSSWEQNCYFAKCCAEMCHNMAPLPTLTTQCKTKQTNCPLSKGKKKASTGEKITCSQMLALCIIYWFR